MSSLVFQQSAATFRVEERLAYEPSGSGPYIFAQVLKRDLSTESLKRRISEHAGIPLATIRHAGRKDTAATAVQWLSWPEARQRRPLESVPGAEILRLSRHGNALSVGHVHHNCFALRLRHSGSADRPPRLEAAFPNFYGRQRFGHLTPTRGDIAQRLARPQKPAKSVSVYQAWLFNQWLRCRLTTTGWDVMAEDLWTANNGKRWFTAELDTELRDRFHSGSISPTGPLFGYKVTLTAPEREFLAGLGLKAEDFRPWGKFARGARRPLFVKPGAVEWARVEEGWIDWRFELPAGVYATVYLSQVFFRDIWQNPLADWPDFTEPVSLPLEPEPARPGTGGGR